MEELLLWIWIIVYFGDSNKCYPECKAKCNSKTTSLNPNDFNIDYARIDILHESIDEINDIIKTVNSGKRFEGKDFTNGNLNRIIWNINGDWAIWHKIFFTFLHQIAQFLLIFLIIMNISIRTFYCYIWNSSFPFTTLIHLIPLIYSSFICYIF